MHTAEPFLPEPSASEVEVAIGKLKMYKSPGVDQIAAELIQAGGETLRSEIHKLIKLAWNKEELPHQWKESIVVPVHKKGTGHISFWPMLMMLIQWEKTDTIKKNTEALLDASKEIGLEVNPETTKYMLMSHSQKTGRKRSIKIANRSFEDAASSNTSEQH
jgi:hypothetical protein